MSYDVEDEAWRAAAEEGQQYFTPKRLADKIAEWADVSGVNVLEPSCGDGALAVALAAQGPKHITLVDDDMDQVQIAGRRTRKACNNTAVRVDQLWCDFLDGDCEFKPFEVVVMNPPFTNGQDCLHVAKALEICPEVIVLARANFMWGAERHREIFSQARVERMAVLVKRPNFGGPAMAASFYNSIQKAKAEGKPEPKNPPGPRHDYAVYHLSRAKSRRKPSIEWWTDNWNE